MEQRINEINRQKQQKNTNLSYQNLKREMAITQSKSLSRNIRRDKYEFNYALHYSKWHSESKEHEMKMKDMYRNIIKQFLPEDKNAHILDLGCGMGYLMLTLKELGYKNVIGIEISKEQVESCRKKDLNVVHTNDTIAELYTRQNFFEVIFCMDVLEHIAIDDQLPFVDGIFTALKTGGNLMCTVPNANSTLASRWRYIDWTHVTSFTEHSIDFLLKNVGFINVQIKPVDPFVEKKSCFQHIYIKFTRWFRRMEMIAELGVEGKHIPLSINLLVSGHKG